MSATRFLMESPMPFSPPRGNFDLLVDHIAALDDNRRGMFKSLSGETLSLPPDQVARQIDLRANVAKANTLLKALVDQRVLSAFGASKFQAKIHRLERGLI
jgi:hypothetical protein